MEIELTQLPGVVVVKPKRLRDDRGFFSETYNERAWRTLGLDYRFVQDNHVHSAVKGVVRGLHYQIPPAAQAKLVRVVRGAVLDVVVDLRRKTPTFGQHVAMVLSAENGRQLLVPIGCAHGYATLEPNSDVLYKVTDFYAPDLERGILWNDPALGIDWGLATEAPLVSERDQKLPRLADAQDLFN
jgi:dTDP-4-dehydrorhamnose 3,5-epimerase